MHIKKKKTSNCKRIVEASSPEMPVVCHHAFFIQFGLEILTKSGVMKQKTLCMLRTSPIRYEEWDKNQTII